MLFGWRIELKRGKPDPLPHDALSLNPFQSRFSGDASAQPTISPEASAVCVSRGTNIEQSGDAHLGQECATDLKTCGMLQMPQLFRRDEVERPMAGSVNKVILVGNLGRDPEVRRLIAGSRW